MPKVKITQLALVWPVLIALASVAAAQQSASQAPWGGWARCEINVSGQGYSDQQTHTWTISSSTSTVSGAFRVYPATWSVAGSAHGSGSTFGPDYSWWPVQQVLFALVSWAARSSSRVPEVRVD